MSDDYGYVFIGPDGEWHWSAKWDAHESATDQREATACEASFARDNNRLLAALTPSAATKAAYMGEVETDVFGRAVKTTVDWTAIKAIMALIRKQAGVE